MKNSKNKRTAVLAIILVGLLVIAYKVIFVAPPATDEFVFDENAAVGEKVQAILLQVENINFDTTVLNDPKFQSLKSIDTPLPSLPIGKKNPFSK